MLKVFSVGPGSRTVLAGGKDEFTWPFVDIAVAKGPSISDFRILGGGGGLAHKQMYKERWSEFNTAVAN